MGDVKSAEYRKMRDERRELIQLAVEELIKRDGCIPNCGEVAGELGMPRDSHVIRRDWDWLNRQGRLPERPGCGPVRPRKVSGGKGGALLLEAEALLHAIGEEIASASPEYKAAARDFWVAKLDTIATLAEGAMALAVGSTVDDFIGLINEKGK